MNNNINKQSRHCWASTITTSLNFNRHFITPTLSLLMLFSSNQAVANDELTKVNKGPSCDTHKLECIVISGSRYNMSTQASSHYINKDKQKA